MSNVFKGLADFLGVELNEEFTLSSSTDPYRLTEKGLEVCLEGNWVESVCPFNSIFKASIQPTPFEPDCGDIYYTYGSETFIVRQDVWTGSAVDYARKHSGIVFRNSAEAYKARPKKYEELTGMEWQGE